jgi:glutamine amidotransferase PdxT
VKSGDDLTFSSIFDKKMSAMLQVYREDVRSDVHSLLQPGGESTDLEGLFAFFGQLGFLKA